MKKQILNAIAIGVLSMSISVGYSQDTLNKKKPNELSMKDAIAKGILELKVYGFYNPRIYNEVIDKEGVHFGKCMTVILKSKIDTAILLRLDCGMQLIPDDSAYQTMIVTKKAIFPLRPNDYYVTRFYAMCGQLHDFAPIWNTEYSIGNLADTGIVKLANYLGDNYIQNMIGQHALWAFTDQADFNELKKYGADSITIAKTKEILNNLNLETKLSPKLVVTKTEETNDVSINRYYIYGGAGLLFILTTSIIILIIRRKKNNDKIT